MNVVPDPRGFQINEQGVVAPKVTVFNGGKRRKTYRKTYRNRKNKKTTRKANRKATRRNRRR
jgi:hypothetical protein